MLLYAFGRYLYESGRRSVLSELILFTPGDHPLGRVSNMIKLRENKDGKVTAELATISAVRKAGYDGVAVNEKIVRV